MTEIPPLPENATPEEKDAHWLKYVYQGDSQPQLTWRAVIMGGILGMFLSVSNLYTTLKLGWSFGVAITACVLSFVIWNAIRALSGQRLSQMSLLENNCMQSTASAAGYSTGGTVGSAFAALFLIQGKHPETWVIYSMVFLTAALGVFLAIPMKRQMINHEKLAFPSGIAAAETLRSLYSAGREALHKAYALIAGLVIGGIIGGLKGLELLATTFKDNAVGRIAESVRHMIPVPELLPFPVATPAPGAKHGGLGFEPGVLMIGAGMIMGLRVSLSMLIGSAVLYFGVAPGLVALDVAHAGEAGYHMSMWKPGMTTINPFRWGVWGGTAIMVMSSLTAMALQWRTVVRAFRIDRGSGGADQARIEVPGSWLIIGLVPITLGLMFVLNAAFHVNFALGLLAVALSFVLALVACRATGETDTTPIGAMGKITQFVYAGLAPSDKIINLMSAGTTAAAAGSSADLLTDLKSGYLLGANPRKQFLAQFAGIFFGTIAIVPMWFVLAPSVEHLTKSFDLPAAQSWKAMADLLATGIGSLPTSAAWAVAIGAVLGVALPLLETAAPKLRPYLPSAMGLGLGCIVSLANGLSFTVGALIALAWTRLNRKQAESFNVPVASGFIAGESLILAIIAIACAAAGLAAVK